MLVDVVAPASSCDRKIFEKGMAELTQLGFKPRHSKNFMQGGDYVAQSIAFRSRDLHRALNNSQSKIVWCARGGFGCQHLLPSLSAMKKPKQRKLLIGYSDITALHLFLMQKWNWPVLHASLVSSMADAGNTYQKELIELIFGEREFVETKLRPLNAVARRAATLKSTVTGGNLKVVQCALDTVIHPKFAGKIVFFEDTNERGYSLDRMLTQITQAGIFEKVKAVVFGDLIKSEEPNGKNFVPLALERFAAQAKFPVLDGYPFGHGENKKPVPMGTPAKLQLGRNPTLQIWGP